MSARQLLITSIEGNSQKAPVRVLTLISSIVYNTHYNNIQSAVKQPANELALPKASMPLSPPNRPFAMLTKPVETAIECPEEGYTRLRASELSARISEMDT
jgi:hypothetical protein